MTFNLQYALLWFQRHCLVSVGRLNRILTKHVRAARNGKGSLTNTRGCVTRVTHGLQQTVREIHVPLRRVF